MYPQGARSKILNFSKMSHYKLGLSGAETKKIFDKVTVEGSTTISYTDFLAACAQSKVAIDDYMIKDAFAKFDLTGYCLY